MLYHFLLASWFPVRHPLPFKSLSPYRYFQDSCFQDYLGGNERGSLYFSEIWLLCVKMWISLGLSCFLGVAQLLDFCWSFTKFGMFSNIVFCKYFSTSHSFFSSSKNSNEMLDLLYFPKDLWGSDHFYIFN